MKIATFNVNGVNGRLSVLLRWLEQAQPDVVCLQELKTPDERFPVGEIEKAGYGSIWHGQKSWNGVAILSRGRTPIETRRGLPGDSHDSQSRYIEAAINGMIVACLYLPNGNPAPGPKFDYKLRWFRRLTDYAAELLGLEVPVVLAGDYNVMPTELDVYKPERWADDALFRPEVREAFRALVAQGWTEALRTLHPGERIYTFWDYFRNAWGRNAGLRLDHFLRGEPDRRAPHRAIRYRRIARRGTAEATQLREDEPHPEASLAPGAKFAESGLEGGGLRGEEPQQIEGILLHTTSCARSVLGAAPAWLCPRVRSRPAHDRWPFPSRAPRGRLPQRSTCKAPSELSS